MVIKITPEFIQKGDCLDLAFVSFYACQKTKKEATI